MRSSGVQVTTPGPTIGAPLMKMSINTANLEDKFGERPVNHNRKGSGVNWKHVVYLVVVMGIGSGLLDVIINAGLTALLYYGAHPLPLWGWPDTFGGDILVTGVITGILTWLIAGNLSMRDMRIGVPILGKLTPLHVYSDRFRRQTLYNRFLKLEDLIRLPGKGNWKAHLKKFPPLVLRGIPFTIFVFVFLALPALGVAYGIQSAHGHSWRWTWEKVVVFKGIYGGIMGLIATPIIAILAMCCYEEGALDNDTIESSQPVEMGTSSAGMVEFVEEEEEA